MTAPRVLDAFTLSPPQEAAALARQSDVAVTAGAGTGKTRTLVARYLALLAGGLPLRRIVAVTFTRKAAREMRNRVRQEISRMLLQDDLPAAEIEQWQNTFNELDAARIGTIHNLCAEILRAHPAEIGVDPRFTVLDETQSAILLQEAAEEAMAWAVDDAQAVPLFSLLNELGLQQLITTLLVKRLDAAQVIETLPAAAIADHWQAVLEEQQAVALAQLRAADSFSQARQVLLDNAADNPADKAEAQRRLAAAALQSLASASPAERLRAVDQLLQIDLRGGSQKSWPGGKEQLAQVKTALKTVRQMVKDQPLLALTLNDLDQAAAEAMPAIYQLFREARRAYRELKEEREALDFDDLEDLAIELLANHLPVRAYWQNQVVALLVDEFQDTNERQRQFLRLLAPEPGKLFIVGDAKQSIYRFRGADVAVFAEEKAQIGRRQGALIDLDTSYRTHPPLLAGMNKLLAPILGEDAPDRPPWYAPFAPLKPGLEAAEEAPPAPFIEFHLALGSKANALPVAAGGLARRLVALHQDQGLDFGDMAVLCRASGSFQYYENAFDAAGIPYLTVAGKGFYERPEIRDLLNALQAIADPHDDLALLGLLRSPACGLSDVALYRLVRQRPEGSTLWACVQGGCRLEDAAAMSRLREAAALIADLQRQAGRVRAADLLKRFLDETNYRAIMRRAGQPRALRNVAKLLNDIHESELVSVSDFLEYAETLRSSGAREGEARATAAGAVQIMSIHAAKGLEFPVVVLGDASSGTSSRRDLAVDPQLGILLPLKEEEIGQPAAYALWHSLNRDQEEAESARLLYVALTRAEKMLLISGYVQQRESGHISWRGWLEKLAGISGVSGLDLSAIDAAGGGQHTFDLELQETPIRAVFYGGEQTFQPPVAQAEVSRPRATAGPSRLQKPIKPGGPGDDSEEKRRVWEVMATGSKPPVWLTGSLVHEALALWRFPGSGFNDWLAARARAYGLGDAGQIAAAQNRATALLERFRSSSLFREMDGAERRLHELPIVFEGQTGYVDALFRQGQRWTLVDFKTDELRDEGDLRRVLAEEDYEGQVKRYGEAVASFCRQRPRLLLCFLDYAGGVRAYDILKPSAGWS